MDEQFSRAALLFGSDGIDRLNKSHVILFGVGGVGGYVAEALARSGIGHISLVDSDIVGITNLNRQIIALHSTIGRKKTEVMRDRILDINPGAEVTVHDCFFLPENADEFDFGSYDYVVDAVDTVTAKLEIIQRAKACGTPVISSMGTGDKTDPSALRIADVFDTTECPLARVMRRECRKRGISDLKVAFSTEIPNEHKEETKEELPEGRRKIPGSTAFVPPAAGLIIASEVIKDLLG